MSEQLNTNHRPRSESLYIRQLQLVHQACRQMQDTVRYKLQRRGYRISSCRARYKVVYKVGSEPSTTEINVHESAVNIADTQV